MSGGDAIVNIVLRESYPDIVDLLNVDQVASLLFASGRITLPELDQLQGASGILLTDQKRKHILYSAALADKGQEGLDAFLRALCETAGQYAPHARLLDKLCTKLKARGISPNTVMSRRPKFTRGTGSSATDMSVMEDSQELPVLTPTDCSDTCTADIMIANKPQRCESCTSTATSGYETGTNSNSTATFSLLERCSQSLCNMIPVKLIMLGNVGVGKTSLMYRFVHNSYYDSVPTTVAGDRKNCYLHHAGKGVNIELAIWDTAGQERFSCVSPSYYRNINAVIMVFDMTDNEQRKSLYAVKDWHTQLYLYTPKADIPIILAGNKCKSPAVNKKIVEHAKHMVSELGFNLFMEVSAKENYGVEALFERAITLALESHTSSQDKKVIRLSDQSQTICPLC